MSFIANVRVIVPGEGATEGYFITARKMIAFR